MFYKLFFENDEHENRFIILIASSKIIRMGYFKGFLLITVLIIPVNFWMSGRNRCAVSSFSIVLYIYWGGRGFESCFFHCIFPSKSLLVDLVNIADQQASPMVAPCCLKINYYIIHFVSNVMYIITKS